MDTGVGVGNLGVDDADNCGLLGRASKDLLIPAHQQLQPVPRHPLLLSLSTPYVTGIKTNEGIKVVCGIPDQLNQGGELYGMKLDRANYKISTGSFVSFTPEK